MFSLLTGMTLVLYGSERSFNSVTELVALTKRIN